MTSTKTHNISIQSKEEEETNSFFVSDSIKHLITEESFTSNTAKTESIFAMSDLIAKVTLNNRLAYYDVTAYKKSDTIKLKSDARGVDLLLADDDLNLSLLLKNKNLEINLICKFVEFNKIDSGTYIYTLRICEHYNQ